MMEKQQPVVDISEPTDSFADGSEASPEKPVSQDDPDDTDGETVSSQHGNEDDAGTRPHDDQQGKQDGT